MVHQILVGKQNGWFHDEGNPVGVFNTFDSFHISGWPDRKVHLFMAREYHSQVQCGTKYPLLVVLDGQNAFFPDNDTPPIAIQDTLASLVQEGMICPFVVSIHANDTRDNDYIHEEMVEGIGGGLSSFTEYICRIRDWIISHFAINDDTTQHAILGCSHGGLAAFFIASRKPNIFGICLCLSPSLWAGMDSNEKNPMIAFQSIEYGTLITEIKEKLENKMIRPHIYLDWGMDRSNGIENLITEALVEKRAKELVEYLTNSLHYQFGEEIITYEDQKGKHDTVSWAGRLYKPLSFYLQHLT